MAIIQTRVQLKKDTPEEWEDNGSLVLLDGEMAIEGNRNYKIGDGITEWEDLPYANSNPVLITSSSLTLNASHAECFLSCGTSIQITVPSSFVPVGTQIEIYNSSGNTITLLTGAGVIINGKLTSTTQYEVLTLKQINTNTWISYTNASNSGGGGGALQDKTATPSTSSQVIQPDSGYYGLNTVVISAMPEGTAGTPIATKTQASNHQLQVIPSVQNSAGYIPSETKTGTAVTVSASELVSGALSISQNGNDIDVTNYETVDVMVRAGVVSENDVNFWDYDGTLLYAYSKSGFLSLAAMPPNPEHDGLTAQGWNWTFVNAQSYVRTYGKLDIGQMYATSDNKTRLYITLGDVRLSPYLGIGVKGTAVVDWGDGSATTTLTGSNVTTIIYTQHTYPEAGDYVISISGNIGFGNKTILRASNTGSPDNQDIVYASTLTRVEIGNITSIQSGAFYNCYSLANITMPSTITSIGTNAFRTCRSLDFITIPTGVKKTQSSSFYYCYSLYSVALPHELTEIAGSSFYACYSLARITIPDQVTTIGNSAFYQEYALSEVVMPNSVTSLGTKVFYNTNSLQRVKLSNSLTTIPDGTFTNSFAIQEINMPTNLVTIDINAFDYCLSLSSLDLPNTLTTINSKGLSRCNGLGYIRFRSTTPPTVANSDAFTELPTDCIIYVPASALAAYTSANNYPSSSTYQYVGE